MIIVNNASGQLCNRIMLIAHAYSTGLETNQKVYSLYCGDINKYFIKNKKKGITLCSVSKKINTLIDLVKCIIFGKEYEKSNANKQETKKAKIYNKKSIHIINNWYYRDYEALLKNSDEIKELFTPNYEYQREIDDFAKKHNLDSTISVGVHLRRGDFRIWLGGRFYYTDDDYIHWMNELANNIDGHINFILFSNEKINLNKFNSDNYDVSIGPGGKITDLYSMAKCKYIMGPPSSYSWWAAFYGNQKHLTLTESSQSICIEDFQPFDNLDSIKFKVY